MLTPALLSQATEFFIEWPHLSQSLEKLHQDIGPFRVYYSLDKSQPPPVACLRKNPPQQLQEEDVISLLAFAKTQANVMRVILSSASPGNMQRLIEKHGFSKSIETKGMIYDLSQNISAPQTKLQQLPVSDEYSRQSFIECFSLSFKSDLKQAAIDCEPYFQQSKTDKQLLYIYTLDSKPVGMGSFQIFSAFPQFAYGSAIGLRPELQGQGLGKQMALLCLKEMQSQGAKALVTFAMLDTFYPVLQSLGGKSIYDHDVYVSK